MGAGDTAESRILKVGVTGTGAVASAYIRALVPAGFDVRTFGLGSQPVMAHRALGPDWADSFTATNQLLLWHRDIDPFEDLSRFQAAVPHTQLDLSSLESWSQNPFSGLDAVILTAANPDSAQSLESATRNYDIDRYSIDHAVDAGAKVIIYTSSVWRTMEKLRDGSTDLIDPMKDRAPPPGVHYAEMKARSVDFLRAKAEKYPGVVFIFNDHGWFPRETMGAPIENIDIQSMQLWVAECEMQMHILKQLKFGEMRWLSINRPKKSDARDSTNCYGFNMVSDNNPRKVDYPFPPGAQIPRFRYDLSSSRDIGALRDFNVFNVINGHYGSWRRIPAIGK